LTIKPRNKLSKWGIDTVMISYPPNTPQAGLQIGNKKFEQIWRLNYKVIEKLAVHTYKVQLTPHSL
jgi:hypothetical protein